STLLCWSVAEALMSRASSCHRPDASALPARLTPSGPGNISGNSVRTVARQIMLETIARKPRPSYAGLTRVSILFAGSRLRGGLVLAVDFIRRFDGQPSAGEIDGRHQRVGERQQQG